MAGKIQNTIEVICGTCGSTMNYEIELIPGISGGVTQVIKVELCDRCVRDTFDEAFKIMAEKACKEELIRDADYMIVEDAGSYHSDGDLNEYNQTDVMLGTDEPGPCDNRSPILTQKNGIQWVDDPVSDE